MLKDRLEKDYIEAYKGKDEQRVSTLRLLRAAVKNAEIDKMKKFEDPEVEAVIRTEVKKLRETLETATVSGRSELVAKTETEINILAGYLPEQMDEAAVRAVVAEKIKELGASNPSGPLGAGDFGRVTGEVMKFLKGKADGGMVAKVIKELLTGK